MRVAVIGAGATGLTSARHVSGQGFQCDVFEMASEIGGIWVYTDRVGQDQFGYPVHTVMYQDLRINLPKEIMSFVDFPMPGQDESFVTQQEVLKYLNSYVDHFNLRKLIKFNQMVNEIRPEGNKWRVQSIHKPTKEQSEVLYDFVMVCNGHYNTPHLEKIPGQENFKGKIMHSCDYRKRDPFKNLEVLVIGAGYSGLDVAFQVVTVAQKVVICQPEGRSPLKLPPDISIIEKPSVKSITSNGQIQFSDGSCDTFDVIVHCTGYQYNYPFLHESCGIRVEDNHVLPLYKHVINIERPTMAVMGLPYHVAAFPMFDLQAKFYSQFINGSMKFPPKEVMLKDLEQDVKKRKEEMGLPTRHMHQLGLNQQEYFDDLAKAGNIWSLPEVLGKIWEDNTKQLMDDFMTFRNYKYKVLNERTFVKRK